MNSKKILNRLQEDVEIPEVVQQKAAAAFEKIKTEPEKKSVLITDYSKRRNIMSKKKIAIIAACATLMLGTVTAGAAAYMHWSTGLSDGMRATAEQKVELEESNMASTIDVSDTQAGITVTAQQSIVDNYSAELSFKVDGFKVEDGVQPEFGTVTVKVGDSVEQIGNVTNTTDDSDFKLDGVFYDGLIVNNEGAAEHVDGTPLADSEVDSYTMADGSLEYRISLKNNGEKGFFLNKPIHVEFANLGTVAKAEFTPDVDATWSFDWTLEGSDEIKEFTMDQLLDGFSPSTVTGIEISPISVRVHYNYTQTTHEEILEIEEDDEYGNLTGEITRETVHVYDKPAEPIGIKFKDGSEAKYCIQANGMNQVEGSENEYITDGTLDRIIDVDQVESIIFVSYTPAQIDPSLAPQYFEVPLN